MESRVLPLLVQPQVLFPGATLPVRLWNTRDRRLARDVVKSDRLLGVVVRSESGTSSQIVPRAGQVGCIARVVSARKLPGKQVRLVLEGVERFAIESLLESPARYPIAAIQEYSDFSESPALLETFADEVRQNFRRFMMASGKIGDVGKELHSELPSDAVELSLTLPSIMRLDEETCLRFLSSRSPLMRLRELSALLAPAAKVAEENAEVHQRSRTNGHGVKH